MVATMIEMGLPCDKHHHEVAAAQHELGLTFGTLTQTADLMQVHKYVVHQVAHAYGKTATFMPKPIKDDNGSGMHTHFSIWEKGQPLFAGNGYAGLSDMCLYFIGGVIKHARALNAFTNPTTNSYKRLVPGFEELGRASCRERGCQYVESAVAAVAIKKKNIYKTNDSTS